MKSLDSTKSKWIVRGLLVVVLLLVGAALGFAEPTILPPEECTRTLGPCTAGDVVTTVVGVADVVPLEGCTLPEDMVTFSMSVKWDGTAAAKYDAGLYISSDADPVQDNDACVGSIAPLGVGVPPFLNLDGTRQPGDICGDLAQAGDPVWEIRMTVPCDPFLAVDGSYDLQVEACRIWSQNVGLVCDSLADAGTGSKCDCTPFVVPQIPVDAENTITIVKDAIPATAQDFAFTATGGLSPSNFSLDDDSEPTLSNRKSFVVGVGTYTVQETPAAGWQLYKLVCETLGSGMSVTTDLTNRKATITTTAVAGGAVICRYTNVLPTAVELAWFKATGRIGFVKVGWETVSETDNLGFNLYRAEQLDGPKTKLNGTLIPSNVPPGSPFGAVYIYKDTAVVPGNVYFYWLEDVDIYGRTTLHGPDRARVF